VNVQVACTIYGKLAWISDPVDGSRHDNYCQQESGVLLTMDPKNWIGDKGYIGNNMITPFRKPAGGELLDWQKEYDTEVNKIRWMIEQVISHFKNWTIIYTDYQRPLGTFAATISAVVGLHFCGRRCGGGLQRHRRRGLNPPRQWQLPQPRRQDVHRGLQRQHRRPARPRNLHLQRQPDLGLPRQLQPVAPDRKPTAWAQHASSCTRATTLHWPTAHRQTLARLCFGASPVHWTVIVEAAGGSWWPAVTRRTAISAP
jgi:DDE superfamily endonuclease